MATINVTDASFEEEVLKSVKPVVLDFWAPQCGPCKQIGPSHEEISDEMADKITVAKINIDENPNTPTQFGVEESQLCQFLRMVRLLQLKQERYLKLQSQSGLKTQSLNSFLKLFRLSIKIHFILSRKSFRNELSD